jgi:hypothetical protein
VHARQARGSSPRSAIANGTRGSMSANPVSHPYVEIAAAAAPSAVPPAPSSARSASATGASARAACGSTPTIASCTAA